MNIYEVCMKFFKIKSSNVQKVISEKGFLQAMMSDHNTKQCLQKSHMKYELFNSIINDRKFPTIFMSRYVTPRSKSREKRRLRNAIQQTPT